MFATSGYFRAIVCPFYINGLCERPYCHFRHTKQDTEKTKDDLPNYSTSEIRCTSPVEKLSSDANVNDGQSDFAEPFPTLTSLEQSVAPKSATELLLSEAGAEFNIPSFANNARKYPYPTTLEAKEPKLAPQGQEIELIHPPSSSNIFIVPDCDTSSLPVYYPTPKTPSLPTKSLVSDVPDYQPTPKRELKRRNASHNGGMEYDPENNYSFEGLGRDSVDTDDLQNYKPVVKKAKLGGGGCLESSSQHSYPSGKSLIRPIDDFNVKIDDDDEDEGPVYAEFSDEEQDSASLVEKIDTSGSAEEFEDVNDDDISSDEEFIEVPKIPAAALCHKTQGKQDTLVSELPSSRNQDGLVNPSESKSNGDKIELQKKSTEILPLMHEVEKKNAVILAKSASSSSLKKTSTENQKKIADTPDSVSSTKHHISSSSSKKASSSRIYSEKTSDTKPFLKTESKSTSNSASKEKHIPLKSSDSKMIQSNSKSDSQNNSSRSKLHNSKHVILHKSRQHSSSKPSSGNGKQLFTSDKHLSSAVKHHSVNGKHVSAEKHSVDGKRVSAEKHSVDSKQVCSEKHPSVNSKHLSIQSASSRKHSTVTVKMSESQENKPVVKSVSSKVDSHPKTVVLESKSRKVSESRHSSEKLATSDLKSNKPNRLDVDNKNIVNSEIKLKIQKSSDTPSKSKCDRTKSKSPKQEIKHEKPNDKLVRMNSYLFGDDSDSAVDDESDHGLEVVAMSQRESDIDYSGLIHDSDLEDEDTFDECLRIFKESAPQLLGTSQHKKLAKDLKAAIADAMTSASSGKKRVAHKAAEQLRKTDTMKKDRPRQHLSPAQVMHNRIMEMQRRALEMAAKQAVQEQKVTSTSGTSPAVSGNSSKQQEQKESSLKQRIAHTPQPKTTLDTSASLSTKPASTIATTASKTEKRVAHTTLSYLKRPVIPANFGTKVPSCVRQRYLNLIIDECIKFCSSEEEAFKKGLEEENTVYERASNKNIYLRVAVNTISRLRSEAKESCPSSSAPKQRRTSLTQSHEATLGGSRAAKTSFTLHRSSSTIRKAEAILTESDLYHKMIKYALTEEQLRENGYPRPSTDASGKAAFFGTRYQDTDTLLKDNERTCSRCGKRFTVHSDGTYIMQEECVYHWTRAYLRKRNGCLQLMYNCCNSDTSAKGCQVASNHVHEKNKKDNLTGFMKTIPQSPPPDDNYGIFALDCEMVYTLGGLELARVTVVRSTGEIAFESLVKPHNSVVDYNTRFSGLTAQDLKPVTTTLQDVQAILLSMFSDKTILIGHSLESDLFALKLIHSTVVDTSVVFPHRLGPPYKRALKNLMLEIFQKIIQSDDGGHDSKEDALACMDLMKWKIKEDNKREQRYL